MTKTNDKKIELVYVGGGNLAGVPARDLSFEEVKALGGAEVLLRSRCYRKPTSTSKKEQTDVDKKAFDRSDSSE